MKAIKKAGALVALLALGLGNLPAWGGFEDPLAVAALPNVAASRSPLVGVAAVGNRVVAVGQRGVVVVSEDGGKNWKQAQVPVRADLLAVHFPTSREGWAVGHGGVVIHTADGGLTWTKQLDGHDVSRLIVEYYGKADVTDGKQFVEREQSLAEFGGTQPFMGVYFEDAQRGYVVGTFNRILRTVDGGKSWTPLGDRIDNPDELHFYGIAAGKSGLFVVGEQGRVWMHDKAEDRFVARPTGYEGTLFGIVVGDRALVAHGMRGSVYRSVDLGLSWQRVDIPGHAGVSGGLQLGDGRIVLTTLAGGLLIGSDAGDNFETYRANGAMSYFGVAPLVDKGLVLVGAEGVRLQGNAELAAAGPKAKLASNGATR